MWTLIGIGPDSVSETKSESNVAENTESINSQLAKYFFRRPRCHWKEFDQEVPMNSIDLEPKPLAINAPITPQSGLEGRDVAPQKTHRGLTFWAIIIALSISSILTALENTAVTTSLPVIVQELHIGDNYVWITNAFFLTR